MTNIILPSCNAGLLTTGQTLYTPIGSGNAPTDATETRMQTTWRTAGTFSNIYTRIDINATTGTSNIRYRVGAANGNQNIAVSAAATGEFTDAVNTDTVSA